MTKHTWIPLLTVLSQLALFTGPRANAEPPRNLLRNPSFELDRDRDERPDDWTGPTLPDGSTGALFLDRALPKNGSVQVSVVFMEEGAHVLSQPVKLKPSTQYTVACWIRGRAARGSAWVRFTQTKPNRQQWESKHAPQGHTGWTLYQTTFTTPDDHQAGQIEIVWGLSLQGMFRFDFASLVEGDTPPPPPNTAPRLRQDRFDVQRNALFGIAKPGVLKNDEDADKDELTVAGFTQPAHGTVALAKDGSMTYRPERGFSGVDSFEYRAGDGNGGESKSRVSFNVADLPKPKNLLKNDSFEADSDSDGKPDGWSIGDTYQFTCDANVPRSGRHSVRIDGRKSSQFARQLNVPFRKGKRYRLSAWVKGDAIDGGHVTLQYIHPNGRRHWAVPGMSGTFDWKKVQVVFGSSREQVEGGSVDLLATFKTGRAWIDDVTLEEFPLPYRVFIDGYSVTGGVVPILSELAKDALKKGITDRSISISRSPAGDKNYIRNSKPYDAALLCSWALKPKDKDFPGEVARKAEWKRWFAEHDPGARVMLFHWQPWGLYQWPDGFQELSDDYAKVAVDAKIPIVPTTLAFQKLAASAKDPKAMLRKLYSADYHHAGRVGNYVKACCAFAAVTGKSPVGLTHTLPIDIDFGWPAETLTTAEAKSMQQAAWDAWREANRKE